MTTADLTGLYDDLLALVPPSLADVSGELFYSGRAAFSQPSPIYLLGLNPGGDVEAIGQTIGDDAERLRGRGRWSAYSDEPWGTYAPGQHPYQRSVLHLFARCGLDPQLVPASNVIFARTRSEADLTGKAGLLDVCWPVHAAVIAALGVRVVVALGGTAGAKVRAMTGAHELVESYREQNRRGWQSATHAAPDGLRVVTLTHPSRASWVNPAADPTGLVVAALETEGTS